MLTTFHAIIIGLSQGLTELFPISSLGHSIILPHLFGWEVGTPDDYLSFLVLTHLATALVLFGYFWCDWVKIFHGFADSLRTRAMKTDEAKLAWLLIVATIPAGLLGLLLQKKLTALFTSPLIASIFLILNGVVLLVAERLRRRAKARLTSDHDAVIARTVSYRQAALIGTAQTIALLPGFSRSGAAISGGLGIGLNEENAARFAFLMATPIIGAAALLKLPHVLRAPGRTTMLIGALAAAIAAYLSVRFLVKYFETKSLRPFAIYCILAGLIFSLFLR
jgi:undecaprenyl-diphosphatase